MNESLSVEEVPVARPRARDLRELVNLNSAPQRQLLNQAELSTVLVKERFRCDRGGASFCLLSFEFHASSQLEDSVSRLTSVLFERLRTTDEVGRLSTEIVGVVLPATPVAGAWTVAKDVLALLPEGVSMPMVSVYSYPSDSTPGEHDPSIAESTRRVDGAVNGQPAAQSLELLFAQALPRWKRCKDIAAASIGVVLLSPVLLATAAMIKLTSEGPVFFRQQRAGLGGRPFIMYKFRTMRDGAHREQTRLREFSEQDGPAFKLSNDPRITRLGRFLRRTSIDELPQLWNVLRGEMTLVGPRPLPCEESDGCEGWQRRRLDVTPGMTCTWQITGRSMVSFVDWMRLDLNYAQNVSLGKDLSLILRTVKVMFVGTGK